MKTSRVFIAFAITLLLACSPKPQEINFDVDQCDYCMMTISDERYGAELVTKKGRVYKFDDLHCMKGFLQDEVVQESQVHSLWFVDFILTKDFIPSQEPVILISEELQSPMGSNAATFVSEDEINLSNLGETGRILTWQEYYNSN